MKIGKDIWQIDPSVRIPESSAGALLLPDDICYTWGHSERRGQRMRVGWGEKKHKGIVSEKEKGNTQ